MPDDNSGAALLRGVGLMPDGPGLLGRPIRASRPGVYVVELATPLPRAPLDMVVVGKWIEGLETLRVDGERPTSKVLATRLNAFWLPSSQVVYVGSTSQTIGGRIAALEAHVLGDRRPHASAQWLKTLRIDGLRTWWAATEAPEEYEDALLAAFAATVPPEERAALPDQSVVLPFANLRTPSGARKHTGITGAVAPEDRVAPPPTRHVDLPPGTADGVAEARTRGTARRTNATAPPAGTARRASTAGAATRAASPARAAATPVRKARAMPGVRATATAAAAGRAPIEDLQLTPEGHANLLDEHRELTQARRPEVIDRIRKARELGDLKENADYTSAREEQSFLEGRIQAIEAQLRHAVVIQPTDGHRVGLGSKVIVQAAGEESEFTVVGPAESDPSSGRISSVSPVGRALIGRAAGDEAVVSTPRGVVRYRVVSIS